MYEQHHNPLGLAFLSTLVAALPVLVLFYLLVPRRVLAPWAAAGGAITALVVAIAVYRMPASMAGLAFLNGWVERPMADGRNLRVKAGDGGAGVRRQVADRTVIAREKAAIRSRRGQPQRGRPLPKVCGARSARVLDPRASAGCHWRWARSC